MKVNWIETDKIYHDIIAADDATTRRQLFIDHIIEPWKPMLQMMSGQMNADASDELAGARAWHWMLPDDLTETPDALRKLEEVDAWNIGKAAMQKAVTAFEPYADQMPMDSVEGWLILAKPAEMSAMNRGYTGGVDFMNPRFAVQYDTPNDYNIPRLGGTIVHEMHHLIRLRLFPWGMNTRVADYIMHEGMAESFAAALFGENKVGYFVTDFDDSQLETAKSLIGDGLEKSGFNVIRNYIFGDTIMGGTLGMPDFGGYAIGYRVVQAYLKRTSKNIAEATFLPADEVIAESGYFD